MPTILIGENFVRKPFTMASVIGTMKGLLPVPAR